MESRWRAGQVLWFTVLFISQTWSVLKFILLPQLLFPQPLQRRPLHGQKSSKVKRLYAPNENLVACLFCSPRPWKVRVALTHVTVEQSHTVRVAHSTSNTRPRILLICGHLLHAIRAWHQSIHHCVTARCLHSDTDITLQWVGVEQASFHALPAYCCECNLSLIWVMMAVKSSSQPLLANVLFF